MGKAAKSVTLKMLADDLGLTIATVSRALNGLGPQYRISPKTVEMVCRAAKRVGYRPDPFGRALRMRRTQSIGLILPDVANPYFALIAASVGAVARERGYVVLLGDSGETTRGEMDAVGWMRNRRVDGLVVCPVGCESRHLEVCVEELPVITADRAIGNPPLPCVAADNIHGGALAAEYLWSKGHRSIGILQGLPGSTSNDDRLQGFRVALTAHGFVAKDIFVEGEAFTEESGRKSAARLLDRFPRITAFFALSNVIALGALKILAERSIKVPWDISLISFDDHPYAALLNPPLTVIDQPVVAIGRRAAELLFDAIHARSGVNRAVGERLPVRLIERGSVAIREAP
jgi:LacI family transcriptional regulator